MRINHGTGETRMSFGVGVQPNGISEVGVLKMNEKGWEWGTMAKVDKHHILYNMFYSGG